MFFKEELAVGVIAFIYELSVGFLKRDMVISENTTSNSYDNAEYMAVGITNNEYTAKFSIKFLNIQISIKKLTGTVLLGRYDS